MKKTFSLKSAKQILSLNFPIIVLPVIIPTLLSVRNGN